jgi:hypothetical protein
MTFTIERVIKIYDDSNGDYIYVGPDADGMDSVEIRYVLNTEKIDSQLVLGCKDKALLVAQAIIELYGPKAS